MKGLAKHFGLPLVELPPKRWQGFLSILKKGSKALLKAFMESLPERHVSKKLFKNQLLLRTALLAHAALSCLLKHAYDSQSKTNSKKNWYQALAQIAEPLQTGQPEPTQDRKSDTKSGS